MSGAAGTWSGGPDGRIGDRDGGRSFRVVWTRGWGREGSKRVSTVSSNLRDGNWRVYFRNIVVVFGLFRAPPSWRLLHLGWHQGRELFNARDFQIGEV